jgi:hypothetical protein
MIGFIYHPPCDLGDGLSYPSMVAHGFGLYRSNVEDGKFTAF